MERPEAKALGLKIYTTGRPCKNGHLTYRYTQSGTCAACINGERMEISEERKAAKDSMVIGKFRIPTKFREEFVDAVWAHAIMREPSVERADVDTNVRTTVTEYGDYLYPFRCFAEDVAPLKILAQQFMGRVPLYKDPRLASPKYAIDYPPEAFIVKPGDPDYRP